MPTAEPQLPDLHTNSEAANKGSSGRVQVEAYELRSFIADACMDVLFSWLTQGSGLVYVLYVV